MLKDLKAFQTCQNPLFLMFESHFYVFQFFATVEPLQAVNQQHQDLTDFLGSSGRDAEDVVQEMRKKARCVNTQQDGSTLNGHFRYRWHFC